MQPGAVDMNDFAVHAKRTVRRHSRVCAGAAWPRTNVAANADFFEKNGAAFLLPFSRGRDRENMKTFRCLVLAAGIVGVVGVYNASAQIDTSIEFTTAFPFTVGAHTSVLFVTESAEPSQTPSKSEVVFSRYGTIGYLAETALGERHAAKKGGSSHPQRVTARKEAQRKATGAQ